MSIVVICSVQFTPVLGIFTAVLVLIFVREPTRGKTDGHGDSGVKGKHGVLAYIQDLIYLVKK